MLVGFVPVIVAIKVVFDFLGVVDEGEAFSARSVGLLRRLKLIFAIIAAYEVLGFVGISVATALKLRQENELTV